MSFGRADANTTLFVLFAAIALSFPALAAQPAASTSVKRVVEAKLKAADFWTAGGAKREHAEYDADERHAINTLAVAAGDPVVKLRACKIAADLDGRTRVADCVPDDQAEAAVAGAFAAIEADSTDDKVRRFDPQQGFTHMSVTRKTGHDEDVWVLIESIGPGRESSGLNVRWSPAQKKAAIDAHWGVDRRPARAKNGV